MKNSIAAALTLTGLFIAGQVIAVPVLQIGAPAGPGDTGTYADYQGSTTDPNEDDTAITSGGTLYVAGVYQNQNVLTLGGQSSGDNWSDFGLPSDFNSHDAVLVVSVPDGSLASALASLQVDGNIAFYSDESMSFFPNNHAPVQDGVSDFLFFDIGNFAKNSGAVPDFDPETGAADGEIKTINVTGFGSLAWAHFDVMALQTSTQGQTDIVTTLENNPGSHDVTWKGENGPPPGEIPEPGILLLLAAGLAGIGLTRRHRI